VEVDFMVYRKANGEVKHDYREKAPLAATKDMFLDKDGEIEGKIQRAFCIQVPGTLAGYLLSIINLVP
jgi:gamma-glutamyltranspeptidase/glutathione hydrolase